MTITYGAHGRVVELTLDDTVGFVISPTEPTRRLVPPFRRPNATGEIPAVKPDPVQARFDRFAAGVLERELPPGRHRSAVRSGLLARLFRAFRLGRRDGA